MGGPVWIALLLGSPAPAGDARGLRIEVVQAADCLVADDLEQGITETLALEDEPPPVAAQPWRIEIDAKRQGTGFAAAVAVRGENGQEKHRTLEIEHDSCREVRDAVVLVSALLIDELWAENRTLHAQLSPAPAPPPVVAPKPEPPPKPTTPTPRDLPGWTVLSSALGLMTVGDLPSVAGGVGLRVGFDAPRVVGVQVTATAWPRRETRDDVGAGGRFAAYELGAAVCPRALTRSRLELLVCAGVRAGAVHARGLGLEPAQGNTRARALADASMALRVRVGGPVWIGVGAGLGVPFIRDRFVYGAGSEAVVVHRTWPVVPTFELALGVRSVLTRSAARPTRRARRVR